MKGLFWQYLLELYQDVPQDVYNSLLLVLLLGVLIIVIKDCRNRWRIIARLLLILFIIVLYCSMVIFRPYSMNIGHNFFPFWSYCSILRGEGPRLLLENIMNVVVFIPVGLLIGTQLAQKLQKGWLVAILAGVGISVSIEVLQYFLHLGFSEVDDVMHNTLGCLIGYGLYRLIRSICFKFEG